MRAEHLDTVIIGAGQAGLALSYQLDSQGIEHVVLERARIGESWRSQRWDSFRLNTPAWMNALPGTPKPAAPHEFAPAGDFVASLEGLAFANRLPVRCGVEVLAVHHDPEGDRFLIATGDGWILARNVVLASGSARVPRVPALHAGLPGSIEQLHTSEYRNPGALPEGAVLVVGSGQSGVQIAEELALAGRRVLLATSRVGRMRRRYRGRDMLEWLNIIGFFEERAQDVLSQGGRPPRQFQISGVRGGHTVSYQQLERHGVELCGRLVGVTGSRLEFADDLARNVSFADGSSARLQARIDAHVVRAVIDAPPREHDPADEPYRQDALPTGPAQIDARAEGIGTVIWATGLGPDLSWLDVPVRDSRGDISHHEGVTPVPGLFVAGQPWLRTRRSAMIHGAAADAPYLASLVAARAARSPHEAQQLARAA